MYFDESIGEVFARLKSSKTGISHEDARNRLAQYGSNELVCKKGDSKLKIFLRQFNNFLIYILIFATLVSAYLGEWVDAIAIFVILLFNSIFGFIQEYNAEKSIEALRKMASLNALVIRNGKETHVDVNDLVPGDVIVLATGDKIPADARLIDAVQLKTQEAALTGESGGVEKTTEKMASDKVLADRLNMVYSGTTVVNGRGKAIVTGTGMQSEIGKIAGLIQETPKTATPLQLKLEKLGKRLGMLVLAICIIVFVTGIIGGNDILKMFEFAVSLAVAAVPEGLPAVVTITLAMGIQKMVKKSALIRKLPSVETLGGTSVICTDKTGTLTKNEMTVKKIFTDSQLIEVSGSGYSPEGKFSKQIKNDLLLKIGVLCNDSQLMHEDGKWTVSGDPTEGCLLAVAAKAHFSIPETREKYPRLNEIPFDSERKRMATIHILNGKDRSALVKGAPDSVLGVCNRILINGKVRNITQKDVEQIKKTNEQFSSEALRVLAFAYRPLAKNEKEDNIKSVEKNLIFVGLQGMIDPPREEVKIAVQKCKTAGIKVVMITGDYKGTAVAIGREIGIEGRAVDGQELQSIDLDKEVENIGIYARVNPKDKMKIVEALKKKGHVVAMTGDGVNDAPALKRADIGIAMGITGTDVSKEASDMILTDDNFASIVNAVEEGRGIFDNIRKFVNYLLSTNLAEVLVLFTAMILAGWLGFLDGEGKLILPLTALHILWMNLVTDGPPALALGIDPHSKSIMEKPPRNIKENIISKKIFVNIFLVGLIMTAAAIWLFRYMLQNYDVLTARTVTLTLLVLMQFLRIQIVRSEYKIRFFSNKYLMMALGGAIILQLAIIYTPLNRIFELSPLSFEVWGILIAAVIAVYIVQKIASAIVNMFIRKSSNNP